MISYFVLSVRCSLVTLISEGACIDICMAFILQDVRRTLLFKYTWDAVNLCYIYFYVLEGFMNQFFADGGFIICVQVIKLRLSYHAREVEVKGYASDMRSHVTTPSLRCTTGEPFKAQNSLNMPLLCYCLFHNKVRWHSPQKRNVQRHLQHIFCSTSCIYRTNRDLYLTLRWLMSYIYGAPILDVSRSHTTTQHSR